MDLNYFKYVFDLCQTTSISKSANRLNISQEIIRKAIIILEYRYNILIFNMENNKMELTNEGRIFINHIKNIINKMENITNFYLQSNNIDKSNLKLVSDVNFNISTAIYKFYNKNKASNIKIKVKEQIRDVVINDVITKAHDIGILTICSPEEKLYIGLIYKNNLEYKEIAKMPGYILVGNKNPLYCKEGIDIDDLDGMPVIHYTGKLGSTFSVYFPKKILKLVESNKVMYFNDKKTMERVIATTDAYVFTLDKTQAENTSLKAIPLKNVDITFSLGWIKRKDSVISEEAEQFLEILYDYYKS